tara:strand:- start:914 stop:1066 length:153 start_codon:yes stop_codon:yes gene_type:complete
MHALIISFITLLIEVLFTAAAAKNQMMIDIIFNNKMVNIPTYMQHNSMTL